MASSPTSAFVAKFLANLESKEKQLLEGKDNGSIGDNAKGFNSNTVSSTATSSSFQRSSSLFSSASNTSSNSSSTPAGRWDVALPPLPNSNHTNGTISSRRSSIVPNTTNNSTIENSPGIIIAPPQRIPPIIPSSVSTSTLSTASLLNIGNSNPTVTNASTGTGTNRRDSSTPFNYSEYMKTLLDTPTSSNHNRYFSSSSSSPLQSSNTKIQASTNNNNSTMIMSGSNLADLSSRLAGLIPPEHSSLSSPEPVSGPGSSSTFGIHNTQRNNSISSVPSNFSSSLFSNLVNTTTNPSSNNPTTTNTLNLSRLSSLPENVGESLYATSFGTAASTGTNTHSSFSTSQPPSPATVTVNNHGSSSLSTTGPLMNTLLRSGAPTLAAELFGTGNDTKDHSSSTQDIPNLSSSHDPIDELVYTNLPKSVSFASSSSDASNEGYITANEYRNVCNERDRAQEQISSLLATLRTVTEEAARTQRSHAELTRELDAANTRTADIQANLMYLQTEFRTTQTSLNEENQRLKQQIQDLQNEVEGERSRADDAMGRLRAETSSDLDYLRLERDKMALSKDLISTQSRIHELRTNLENAQDQIRSLENQLRDSSVSALQQRIEVLQKERDEAFQTLKSTQESHVRQQSLIQTTILDFQKALAGQANKVTTLKEQIQTFKQENEQLKQDYHNTLEELRTCENKIDHLENELTISKQEKDQVQQHANEMTSKIQAEEKMNVDISTLMAYATRLESQCATYQRKAAAATLALTLSRLTYRRMRPIFAAFREKETTVSNETEEIGTDTNNNNEFDDLTNGASDLLNLTKLEMIAATPMVAYTTTQSSRRTHLSSTATHASSVASSLLFTEEDSTNKERKGPLYDALANLDTDINEMASMGRAMQAESRGGFTTTNTTIPIQAVARKGHELTQAVIRSRKHIKLIRQLVRQIDIQVAKANGNGDESIIADTLTAEIERSTDAQERLRSSLNAAVERAEHSEQEAMIARRETNEIRIRLQALQSTMAPLLNVIGVAGRLTGTPTVTTDSAVPILRSPSAASRGTDDLLSPMTRSSLSILDAALLSPKDKSSSSDTLHSLHASASTGTVTTNLSLVTPEAITLAGTHITHARMQLDALHAFIISVLPSSSSLANNSHNNDNTASFTALDTPTKTAVASAYASATSASLDSALKRIETVILSAMAIVTQSSATHQKAHDIYHARIQDSLHFLQLETEKLKQAESSMDSLRTIRNEIETSAKETVKTIAELRAALASSQRTATRLDAEAATLRHALATMTMERDAMSAEAEAAKAEAGRNNQQLEDLRNKTRETITAAREQFRLETATLNRERNDLLSRANAAESALHEAIATAAATRQLASEAQEARIKVTQDLERLQRELEQERAEYNMKLQLHTTEWEKRLELSTAALRDDYETMLATTRASVNEEVQRAVATTEGQLTNLANVTAAELARERTENTNRIETLLREQANQKTEMVNTYEQRIGEMNHEIMSLHQRLEQAQKDIFHAQNITIDNDALRDRISALSAAESIAKQQTETYLKEIETLRNRSQVLAETLNNVITELEKQNNENMRLTGIVEELKVQHSEELENVQMEAQFAIAAAEDRAKAFVAQAQTTNPTTASKTVSFA